MWVGQVWELLVFEGSIEGASFFWGVGLRAEAVAWMGLCVLHNFF